MTRSTLPYREEAHGIFAFSLYEPAVCKGIVARIRRLRWSVAKVQLEKAAVGYASYTRRRTRSADILTSSRAEELYRDFDLRVREVVYPLIDRIWQVKLVETCGTQIIRYRKGGRYVAHTDAGVDYAERYFSVVCYLNDDFTGGLTSFPSLEYSTRPQTGKAIIFPSRYFHCAEPVSSGEKFILLTWVCGPIPITWA